jgi:PAS domain S-box-containing protein
MKGFAEAAPDAKGLQPDDVRRLLLDAITDCALCLLDPSGNVETWNAGAERLQGYAAGEVLGRHVSLFFTPDAVSKRDPERGLELALETGRHAREGWRVRKDGSTFWAASVTTPVRDQAGKLIGFAELTQDVSERHAAHAALQNLAHAAAQELDAFSYSISHDLRAPLRALDGFSKIVLESAEHKLDEDERGYLNRIRAAAQRMSQLIDDLLELSRLARTPLSIRRTSLTAAAERILSRLRERDPSRNVEARVEPGLEVEADPQLLEKALEALLDNAWKFTRSRGPARIEVGSLRVAGRVEYFVRDNGVGFDPKYASKLFTPFQRLHSSREYEGTGIGLAIARRIIARHGGSIRCETAPERGVTFQFELGANRAAAGEADS